MVEGETLLVLFLPGRCQHSATVLQPGKKGAVSVHWYNVRAFGDHGNLHSRFLSAPAPRETGDSGDESRGGETKLSPGGLEPWIRLAFAQVPLLRRDESCAVFLVLPVWPKWSLYNVGVCSCWQAT